jgi:hypothetical protein
MLKINVDRMESGEIESKVRAEITEVAEIAKIDMPNEKITKDNILRG